MFYEFILLGVTGDSRNGDSIEKFINIDIYSNTYCVFTNLGVAGHGAIAKLSAGHR